MQKSQSKLMMNFSSISRTVSRHKSINSRKYSSENDEEPLERCSSSTSYSSTYKTESFVGFDKKPKKHLSSRALDSDSEVLQKFTRISNKSSAPPRMFTNLQEHADRASSKIKDFQNEGSRRSKSTIKLFIAKTSNSDSSKLSSSTRKGGKAIKLQNATLPQNQRRSSELIENAPLSLQSGTRSKGALPIKSEQRSLSENRTSILRTINAEKLPQDKSRKDIETNSNYSSTLQRQGSTMRKVEKRRASQPKSPALTIRQQKAPNFHSENTSAPFQALLPRPQRRLRRSQKSESSSSINDETSRLMTPLSSEMNRTLNELLKAGLESGFSDKNLESGKNASVKETVRSLESSSTEKLILTGSKSPVESSLKSSEARTKPRPSAIPLYLNRTLNLSLKDQNSETNVANNQKNEVGDEIVEKKSGTTHSLSLENQRIMSRTEIIEKCTRESIGKIGENEIIYNKGTEKHFLPTIVGLILEEMRQREYRAPYFLIGSGDPTSVSELSKIFTTAPNYGRDQDLSEESTEVLCEVLVNYIRNLPEPIFDTNLWEFLWGFCIESGFEDSGPIKRKSVTKKVFEIMPTRNLSLITCLIEFLNKLVLVPENFLSPEAISEVLGPTFLCVKKSVDFAFKSNLTAQALITIFQARKALCWMIRFWQEVVTVDEKLEFSDGIETPVSHNAESKLYSEGSGFPKQDEAILEAEGFYNYKKLPEELIVDSKQHKDLDSRDKDVEWVSLIPHTPSFISTSFLPTRSKPISPVSAISESVCLSIHHSSCKRFSDLTSVSNIIDLGRHDLELSMKRLSKLRCSISESDRGFSNSKLTESFKYSAQIDTRVPVKSAKKSDELESPLKLSSALPQPEYSSSLGMDESSVSPISPRSDYKEHRTLNCLKSRSTGNFGISKKQSPNNKTTKSSHKDKFSSHENFQDEISSSTKIRSFPRNSSNLSLRISPNNINRLKPNTSNPRCAAPTGILPPTASTRDRWSSIPYDCSMNEKTKAALEKARALQLRSALRATKSKISVTAPLLDGKEKINAALAQVLTCQNELLNLSEILRSLESNYSK